jgi:hypothetical protein
MIPVLEFFPDSPPQVVADVGVTGLAMSIRLWKGATEVVLTPTEALCREIGDTGQYIWDTGKLPKSQFATSRVQFHYQMTDGGSNQYDGDFVLAAVQQVRHPRWSEHATFLRQI